MLEHGRGERVRRDQERSCRSDHVSNGVECRIGASTDHSQASHGTVQKHIVPRTDPHVTQGVGDVSPRNLGATAKTAHLVGSPAQKPFHRPRQSAP
jgi:hypothetical protein